MKLADYNTLAYEFAIRNPRVIELLEMDINDDVVKELLTYGIDAVSYMVHEGQETPINSLQELYLDYEHLKHIKHSPYSPYGEGQWEDGKTGEIHDDFKGHQTLVHPLSKNLIPRKESDEDAIPRIITLIETRGKKLQRLIDGSAFKNYDAVKFFAESVYSLDTSTKTTKTIHNDIEFISEWIQPDKYLQLIPQYKRFFD